MLLNNGAICQWMKDSGFLNIANGLLTLIDRERLFILYQALRQVYYLPGAKLAVDNYFLDKTEHPVYLPTGQSMVIKL